MKKNLSMLALLACSMLGKAQGGYDIKINFKNAHDTVVYLARYTFDKQYLIDTSKVVKGNINFTGKTELDKGIYFLVSQEKARYFDFFVNESQKFSLSTDTADMVKNLKATGSKENEEFFTYIRFITEKNKEFMAIRKKTAGMSKEDSTKFMTDKAKGLEKDVKAFETKYYAEHKGQYLGDVLNLKLEHEVTDAPKASNGRPDSIFQYKYYKAHYWDDVNLADDRVLRTPFFADKLKKYFNYVVVQHPDSVTKEIDWVMSKTKEGSDMYKFLLAYFTPTYETSKIMGFDKVFVHIIDVYFRTGKAKGVYEDKTIEKIIARGDILKNLLLGAQAPDLLMIDTTNYKQIRAMGFDTAKTSEGVTKLYYNNIQKLTPLFTTLYGLKKTEYTLLVFWDVDCGHCQTEIPKLLDTYHKLKNEGIDITVLSVYTQHDFEKWRKYIIEHKLDWLNVFDGVHINPLKEKYDINTTPVIYLLDKNKTIKAKRIDHEQVEELVKSFEKERKTALQK